ncbi:linear Ubiquitin E3 ligase isoform X6 [Musca autumnalis]|uniref:linear Ubiquitin E3 ligase isoform X6 n=1 Tax=Musca autumnalis TaxID=221902 RepID=UPI003CE6FC24
MALQANNRNLLMRNERTMPAWVTEQSDRIGPKPPPPPLATENGHVTPAPNKQPALPPKTSAQPEPDYEVIEFSNQQYSNTPMRPSSASSGSKTPDTKLKCTLCGSSNPWVMCEECSKQIFCASCDDMFHKHPKRKNHLRKTLEQSNPPLPPKQLPGQPGPTPPVAPPRRNKRGLMTPLMQRKDQVVSAALPVVPPSPTPSMKNASWHERVGSLKRGLSILNRPLPETPKTPTTPSESSRCTTPKSVFDNIQRPPSVVLEKIKNKANATLDRMQMLQQRYRQQKEQMERDRSGYGSEQQRQLALQHHKLAAQRANQLGQRGMSSSVFNLNQASRKPPVMNNGWSNNSMQQAQSMAQLNCANCNHSQQGNWGQPHPMHMNHDPWSNQLSSQQHLNRSNLSLNVGAGYMMPPQHSGMYPPPVFMNQRGMMGQMFAQSYMPGMPVMNPGLVGMPPSASRAASRAGSRMASPALSRKSVTLRRKQRASYHNDEATDDEDSDEDDRRSMVSNRSAMSRTRQRRMSSASQIQMEEDFDSGQQRSRVRSQRRDSVAKSVHNDWAPGRKISTNTTRSGDSGFNSPRQKPAPNRIYSDLDSEGSGTRALVQAKIEQKLKEESLKQQKQTKSKRRSESPPKQKHSMAVQTPVGHNKKKEEIPAEKSATESEAEEDEEEEEEEEEVEEEQNQQELTNAETQEEKHETNNVQPVQENGEVNGTELDVPLEDEDAVSLGPPPSTPDQEWECEFCTFVNEPNIKICTICCKTPSKPPKLVAKSVSPPKQVKPVTTKEQKTGMAKAENTTTTSSPNEKAKPILAKNSTSVSTASLSTTTTTTNNNETTTTSSTNTLKKKESVEDIWAALDENIQATANEVTRKAESASSTSAVAPAKKSNNKVSTACGTSARRSKSASVERHVEESRKSQAREIGTSPPPQTISTQTYETLPLKKMADKEESPSVKPVTVTNGFQDSVQESDLLKYTSEELNAALKYCGPDMHPLIWLRDNWPKLIQTVQSLATKYGQERAENTIGTISQMEAREALRLHTGNIWQAVSECIEQRQRKYREISSKGNFSREDVVTALTTHQGNVEMALLDLGRTQLKPFLMRIWGSPGGVENESGAMIIPPSHNNNESYSMDKDIHNFLSANASDCMQIPNANGAFSSSSTNQAPPSPFDLPESIMNAYETHQTHLPDNTSTYSSNASIKDFAASPQPSPLNPPPTIDEAILNNKSMLKDLESLIGSMEQNQQKQNEQVLRSIKDMIDNMKQNKTDMVDYDDDPEDMRILTKSPINTSKFKQQQHQTSSERTSMENEADVKNFVWQHIQEIVPNLVQQVEMELLEDSEVTTKLELPQENHEVKAEDDAEEIQAPLPPPPPPIDQDEFLMEEVIKPNLRNASIREVLPPEYMYTAEIATFQMAFDKALQRDHQQQFKYDSLKDAYREVYKMYLAPEADSESEEDEDEEEEVRPESVVQNIPATIHDMSARSPEPAIPTTIEDLPLPPVVTTTIKVPQIGVKVKEAQNSNEALPSSSSLNKVPEPLIIQPITTPKVPQEEVPVESAREIEEPYSSPTLNELQEPSASDTTPQHSSPALNEVQEPSIAHATSKVQQEEVGSVESPREIEESHTSPALNKLQDTSIAATALKVPQEKVEIVEAGGSEVLNESLVKPITASTPEAVERKVEIEVTPGKDEPHTLTASTEVSQSKTMALQEVEKGRIQTNIDLQDNKGGSAPITASSSLHDDNDPVPSPTNTSSNIVSVPEEAQKSVVQTANESEELRIATPVAATPADDDNLSYKSTTSSVEPADAFTDVDRSTKSPSLSKDSAVRQTPPIEIQNTLESTKDSSDSRDNIGTPNAIENSTAQTTEESQPEQTLVLPTKETSATENSQSINSQNKTEAVVSTTETSVGPVESEANKVPQSQDSGSESQAAQGQNSGLEKQLPKSQESVTEKKPQAAVSNVRKISKIPVRRTASNTSLILPTTSKPPVQTLPTSAPSETEIQPKTSEDTPQASQQKPSTNNNEVPADISHDDGEEDSDEELYSLASDTSLNEIDPRTYAQSPTDTESRFEDVQSPTSTNEMFLMIQHDNGETSMEESTVVPSTSSSTIHSAVSFSSGLKSPPSEFIPSGDPSKQNLSELVKDTQRLIKQMREEISMDDFESSTDEDDYSDYSDEYDEEEEIEEEEEDEEYEEEEDDLEDLDEGEEGEVDDDEEEGQWEDQPEEFNEIIGDATADAEEDEGEEHNTAIETVLTSTLEKGTLNEHASAEEPSATVAIKAESMPITIDNVLESENSLPELATEIVLAPVTEMLPPQTENSIPELPAEVVLTTETIPENTTASTSSMEVINPSTTDSSSSQIATTSSSTLSSNKDHEKPSTSTTSKESPKLVKSESMEDDNRPSTSKQAAKPKATTNKKKDDSKTTTTTKKTVTASKIPKPNTSQRDQKPKASNEITKENNNSKPKEQPSKEVRTPTVKSKTEPKMILPTRSKSFSGPPTPIVLTSVKTITQRFQTQQKSINSKPQLQKAPTTIARKPSITEAIARLTRPSSSTTTTNTELPTTSSSLFKTRTTPRIPKKKYHETCFSDDDYESTTSEEEPEPIEIRQRKMSVPVFRAYPSVQEPEEVNTEELVDKFVKEELVNTIAEAQIAAALIGMKFQQDVSIWAAKECSDLEHAIALLKQDCELCSGTYALNEIVSMLKCTHKCCKQCAKTYFTVQITERSINDCNCPFCKLPELHNQTEHEDDNLEYFSNLDIFLKNIVEPEVHELFQRKLRDRTLLKDPNFKWCVQCSSGFFARPKQKRLICPDCGSVTCASCRKPWQKQHEGISCEKFLEWEMANDPAVQALGVKEHLDQNGIDCPKCKFRYSLARGGCMHFTCTQCKYEFCYGCAKPFMMGAKCTISPYCAKLGLHAHHPRNCLFYLRDKLPIQLQLLLKNNGVEFEVDPIETNDDSVPESSQKQAPLCPIPIQKETPNGLVDTKCNSDVPDQHAGMCRTHYVEYLTAKVAKAKIDPLPIFDLTDCVQELRRRGIPLPERGPWDTDEIYKGMCAEVIQKNIPLETN